MVSASTFTARTIKTTAGNASIGVGFVKKSSLQSVQLIQFPVVGVEPLEENVPNDLRQTGDLE